MTVLYIRQHFLSSCSILLVVHVYMCGRIVLLFFFALTVLRLCYFDIWKILNKKIKFDWLIDWLYRVPGSLILSWLIQIINLIHIQQMLTTCWQAIPELLDCGFEQSGKHRSWLTICLWFGCQQSPKKVGNGEITANVTLAKMAESEVILKLT